MWRERLAGLAAMALGIVLTLGAMEVMNAADWGSRDTELTPPVTFDVKPPKRAPPKARPRPKPKPRTAQTRAPRAPMLGASLSGLDFGMASFGDGILAESDSLLGEATNVVMTADAVDAAPVPRQQRAPTYPGRARAKSIEGQVTLSLLITADGQVSDARVLSSTPDGWGFAEAAVSAVQQWTFTPARYKGRAVAIRVTQPLTFRLQ